MLKTCENALTLLYIGLLSHLFVTNTIDWSSLPKKSISQTWSLQSLTIQSICGKLLTNYFIANLLHHYLPLPQTLLSLTNSLTSSLTKFPNFIFLSPAILLLHPHTPKFTKSSVYINQNPPSATKSTYMKRKLSKSNVSSHKINGFHKIQYCLRNHAFVCIYQLAC